MYESNIGSTFCVLVIYITNLQNQNYWYILITNYVFFSCAFLVLFRKTSSKGSKFCKNVLHFSLFFAILFLGSETSLDNDIFIFFTPIPNIMKDGCDCIYSASIPYTHYICIYIISTWKYNPVTAQKHKKMFFQYIRRITYECFKKILL